MKGMFTGVLLLLAAFTASAEEYNGIPDRFFNSLFAHQYEQAFDAITPKRQLVDEDASNKASLAILVERLKGITAEYKYYELVSEEKVGTRYVTLLYVIGLKDSQAGVRIRLYKPDDEWKASTFSYQSKYADLAKQIASGE